jgi:hypothetical protein
MESNPADLVLLDTMPGLDGYMLPAMRARV